MPSDYQLVELQQEGKPLAFPIAASLMMLRIDTLLASEQDKPSVSGRPHEFRTILLGHKIVRHTDHMNIIYGVQ
jgi:hypothetical protein